MSLTQSCWTWPSGAAIWNDITNLSAPSPHQFVLTVKPHEPLPTLEGDLFGSVIPYPASVWGKFVTPGLKQDDLSYFAEAATNPAGAAKSPAFKTLSAVLTKIASYNPLRLVGDGPYQLTRATLQEDLLTKWNGFYDASKITVPKIIYEGTSQNEVNAELLSGRVDFSNGWLYMPPAILDQWLHTPDANLQAVPGTLETSIIFNDSEYPFNITKVRQALAYALPISKMDVFSWGSQDAHAVAPVPPDGLVARVAQEFMSPKQIASLNPYSYDPSTAAKLLASAGFKKASDGTWLMPNGKPFKLHPCRSTGPGPTRSLRCRWQRARSPVSYPGRREHGREHDVHQRFPHRELPDSRLLLQWWQPQSPTRFRGRPHGQPGELHRRWHVCRRPWDRLRPRGERSWDREGQHPYGAQHRVCLDESGPQDESAHLRLGQVLSRQVPFLEYAAFANQIAFSSRNFKWPSVNDPLWVQSPTAAMTWCWRKSAVN